MIRVIFNHKTLEFDGSMTAGQLLKKMNLLPEVVLVARNGEIITEDELLRSDDEVEIIRAISGGAIPHPDSLRRPRSGAERDGAIPHPDSLRRPPDGSGHRRSESGPAQRYAEQRAERDDAEARFHIAPRPSPLPGTQRPEGAAAEHAAETAGARVTYRIKIKDWPEGDRPREKLIELGPESLNDAELLAILLRTGVKGLSAVDLARKVLKDVGGWTEMVRTDPADFRGLKGMGPAKVAQILAAFEVGRRAAQVPRPEEFYVRSSRDVFQFVEPKLRDLKKEVLDVLFLNSRNKVLAQERLSKGTVNRSSVFAREIVERALRRGAAAIILVHNHPSGDPAPSAEDERVTREMVWAGELLSLCVLDHVVVGGQSHYSFADEGKIEAMRRNSQFQLRSPSPELRERERTESGERRK